MSRYFTNDIGFARNNAKKGSDQLTNFIATIDEELTYHDAAKKTTVLKISGHVLVSGKDNIPLPQVTVSASEFASMGWVADQWGMAPIIFPVESAERDLKTAIQLTSNPVRRNIYTHTGWTTINGRATYLTMSGGINNDGLDTSLQVQLPSELNRYRLPPPSDMKTEAGRNQAREAWTTSMRIANIGPKEILWPMILAAYRSAVGPADFAMHVTGKTGTFKSEVTSLIQSHFGAAMDARHLPASWSSTENANEALLYRAKDAICTVDDFVPQGTTYQVKNLQAKADRLIRGQGNQAGRARLTDISSLQQTMYPRGIILSSGEDTPEGHSVRGRMMILEISPGSIPPERLSEAQAKRDMLPQAMSNWIHWLTQGNGQDYIRHQSKIHRDGNLGIGHSRTPHMMGELIATADLLCQYARDSGFYPAEKCAQIRDLAWKEVLKAGENQLQYLQEADPIETMLEAIKKMMATNVAHARTRNGGVPKDAIALGFTKTSAGGEAESYTSHGPCIGWVDYKDAEFLLDPNHLTQIKKVAGIGVTDATLTKRMKEAGILTRTDTTRGNIKIRSTAGGSMRYVIAIDLTRILEAEEATA